MTTDVSAGRDVSLDFMAPLFVPGHRPERFATAAATAADAIIIDLEDAVPAAAKPAARAALTTAFTDKPVLVRINGIGTPWHADDVAAVAGLGAAALVVPKAEAASELAPLAKVHPLIALVETVRGVAGAREIAGSGLAARLAFGSVDYAADLGCAHARAALASARSELLVASRLGDLPAPLDGVTTDFMNAEAVLADARHARLLGFGGKLCIHPVQVPIVLEGFRPSQEEVAWAQRVLASRDGATAVDGEMIDAPVRARARKLIARAPIHALDP